MSERCCARCGNTVFSEKAAYCKKCGLPVHNTCTNVECGDLCDNDAAFCEICGSETTYASDGVVEAYSGTSSFVPITDIDPDELPF